MKFATVVTSVLAIAAVFALPATSSAAGGNYTQILCGNPDTGQGVGAPTELHHINAGAFPHLEFACSGEINGDKGITFRTGLPDRLSQGASGEFYYQAPANLTVQSGHVFRILRAPQGADHGLILGQHGGGSLNVYGLPRGEVLAWPDNTFVDTGSSSTPFSAANRRELAISETGTIWRYTGGCSKSQCSTSGGDAYLRIFGGKVQLRDSSSPQLTGSVMGSLATDGTLAGTAEASLSATDTGSGVYRYKIVVDGVTRTEQNVDSNDGKCQDVNPATPDIYEFAAAVPCKLSAGGTIALDTRVLSEGPHNVQIHVEDAGGNVVPVLNRNVVVDNIPDLTAGIGGTSLAASGGPFALTFKVSRKRLKNGQALRYFGKFTGSGTGKKFVDVQVRRSKRRWQVVCSVQTDASGVYACRHRFKRTWRKTRYVFRARVRGQAGTSSATIVTPVRVVVVRP